MSGDLYLYDDSLNTVDFFQDELFVFEYTFQQEITSTKCIEEEKRKRNIVIAVDQSGSMFLNGNQIARDIITELIEGIDKDFNEIAIIGFNTKNYLLKNFSSDKVELSEVFSYLDARGSSSIDAALINEPTGAINLAKSKENCDIIIITDGTSTGNFNQINNSLSGTDISIYSLMIGNTAFDQLENLSKNSNGVFVNGIGDDKDALSVADFIRLKNSNAKYCRINWRSRLCRSDRILSITHSTTSNNFITSYQIDEENLPSVEFSNDVIKFGVVPLGQSEEKTITITPRNSDLIFNDVQFQCDEFSIINELPDTLFQDLSYDLILSFEPTNENYKICEFIIDNKYCDGIAFYASGGPNDGSVENKELSVIQPKRLDKYFPNEAAFINWSGILPRTNVKIEISDYDSNNWELINPNTNNPPYKFNTPSEIGDYKIKVSQLSNEDRFSNVNYINSPEEILLFDWDNTQSKIAIANEDNEVETWDPFSESSEGNIGSGFIGVRILEWANTIDRAAVFRDFGDDKSIILLSYSGDDIIELNGSPDTLTTLSWNKDDSRIAAALMSGDVYIWDDPISSSEKSFDHVINNVSVSQPLSMDWSSDLNEIAMGDFAGNVYFINPELNDIDLKRLFGGPISNVKWNSEGDTLFVFAQNQGVYLLEISKTGNQLRSDVVFEYEQSNIYTADWHSERNKIFIGVNDEIQILDPESGQIIYTYEGHSNDIRKIDCSNDYTASLSSDNQMHIWSELDAPHEANVLQSAISEKWSVIPFDLRIRDITFSDQCLGFSKDTLLASFLINRSDKEIIIDSVISSNPTFKIQDDFPIVLDVNESRSLKISINPNSSGLVESELQWFTNVLNLTSEISTNIIDPDVQIIQDIIDFGNVNIGISNTINSPVLLNGNDFEVLVNDTEILYGDLPFDIISNKTFTIPENEEHVSSFVFNPIEAGEYSGIIKYYADINCTPLEIIVTGNAVYPEIEVESLIDFGLLECRNNYLDSIQIKNTGTGDLLIFDPEFSNNIFNSLESNTITIEPGSNYFLPISIDGSQSGTILSSLSLGTNLQLDGAREIELDLIVEINNVEISLSQNELVFIGMGVNETSTKSFTLLNSSNSDYEIELIEYSNFQIISAEPNPVTPNSSSTLTVEFKGGELGVEYSKSHSFNSICGVLEEIEFIARPGSSGPSLTAFNSISFPDQICSPFESDTLIQLVNSGTNDLVIESFEFDEGIHFSLEDNNSLNIEPGRSSPLIIKYNPSEIGDHIDKLILNTNIPENNGIFEINLFGRFLSSSLEFSSKNLIIENVQENSDTVFTIEIENNGSFPETFDLPINSGKFTIDSISNGVVNPNESQLLFMSFSDGELDQIYSSTFELFDECSNLHEIILNANVRSSRFAVINIGTAKAQVGDTVNLSITFDNPKDIVFESNFNISTTLTFNSTILYPLTDDIGTVENGLRYLPIKIENLEQFNEAQIQIPFLATLGNSVSTIITSEGTIIDDDNDIWFVENQGDFELTNVCFENGEYRLVNGYSFLLIGDVYPNPANDIINLDLNLIEDGEVQINVLNFYGQFVKQDQIQSSRDYIQYQLNVSDLSSGAYLIRIETRSQIFYRQFVINN